jgi:hypothetical protein
MFLSTILRGGLLFETKILWRPKSKEYSHIKDDGDILPGSGQSQIIVMEIREG